MTFLKGGVGWGGGNSLAVLWLGISAGRMGSNPDQGTKIPPGARCGQNKKDDFHPCDLGPACPGWVPAGPQLLGTCVSTVHGSSPFSSRKITSGLAASPPPVQGKWSLMLVSVCLWEGGVCLCECRVSEGVPTCWNVYV